MPTGWFPHKIMIGVSTGVRKVAWTATPCPGRRTTGTQYKWCTPCAHTSMIRASCDFVDAVFDSEKSAPWELTFKPPIVEIGESQLLNVGGDATS